MSMNRAQFAKLLRPGLNKIFGLAYNSIPDEWNKVYESNTSTMNFEEDQLLEGFGVAPVKREGAAVEYDNANQLWQARYVHEVVALAFSITKEMMEDNLYGAHAKKYTRSLARSMKQTKELKAVAILNNAFDNDYKGGDGVSLFSAAHPTRSGNQSNMLATPADLSETALEEMCIQISNMKDDRGINIGAVATQLIIPTSLMFEAERILKSSGRSGTADNDLNTMRNYFRKGSCVMHRLVDPNAWYLQTDVPDGLKHFTRRKLESSTEADFSTDDVRYKTSERYSFGWTDWRGIYGSAGA